MTISERILQLAVEATNDLGLGEVEQKRLVSYLQKAYDLGLLSARSPKE